MSNLLTPSISFKYLIARELVPYGDFYMESWLKLSASVMDENGESDYDRQLKMNNFLRYICCNSNQQGITAYIVDGVSIHDWIASIRTHILPHLATIIVARTGTRMLVNENTISGTT